MRDILIICALFWLAILSLVFLSGCAPVQVAPNLKLPEAKACPTLAMPPIAEVCTLYIRGDQIVTDACGDSLLRGYVRARQLLKPAAGATSSQQ